MARDRLPAYEPDRGEPLADCAEPSELAWLEISLQPDTYRRLPVPANKREKDPADPRGDIGEPALYE